MKDKIIEIITSNSTEEFSRAYGDGNFVSSNALDDIADGIIKLFDIPVVINCKATTHELKTWIPYYKAVVGGVKQFEVRKDDRNFKEGDILHLREWDNTLKQYTGRNTKMGIRYILKGGAFGVKKGYVIMGLCCL